jgi:hypothetical protein
MNRYDGPEDGGLSERCLTGGLPEFGTAFGGSATTTAINRTRTGATLRTSTDCAMSEAECPLKTQNILASFCKLYNQNEIYLIEQQKVVHLWSSIGW